MTQDEYVNKTKSLLTKVGTIVVCAEISVIFPGLLQTPIVGFLVKKFVSFIIETFVNKGESSIFFNYIDMRVDAQSKGFDEASIDLYLAQLNGTPEQRAIAEKNVINKLRELVKFKN